MLRGLNDPGASDTVPSFLTNNCPSLYRCLYIFITVSALPMLVLKTLIHQNYRPNHGFEHHLDVTGRQPREKL